MSNRDPEVFVILKEGDSHGTRAGTPLCVDLDEKAARMTKIGRCVRYVPANDVIPGVRVRRPDDSGDIEIWSEGHAHRYSPTSSLKYAQEQREKETGRAAGLAEQLAREGLEAQTTASDLALLRRSVESLYDWLGGDGARDSDDFNDPAANLTMRELLKQVRAMRRI